MLEVGLGLPVSSQAAGEPLAEVDGTVITAEEVERALGAPLAKLQEQMYTLKRQKLEALISDQLFNQEAAKRGIPVPVLLDTEVTSKVTLVTEQEIEAYYQANKGQLKGEEVTVREQIRAQLQNQKLGAQREALLRSLRSKAKVVVHLQAPLVFRALVSVDGAPVKGLATASVTIVKFEDFHCPFCKRVQPTFTELLTKYGDKVKLVHRDFPIDQLHPESRKAHEAARCANEQGKFWAYHDRLYLHAPKASLDQLNSYAQEVGLDLTAFEQCVNSGKYNATVQHDIDEGKGLGVTGTPAFFINGRPLSGAQRLEQFVSVIEEELARGW